MGQWPLVMSDLTHLLRHTVLPKCWCATDSINVMTTSDAIVGQRTLIFLEASPRDRGRKWESVRGNRGRLKWEGTTKVRERISEKRKADRWTRRWDLLGSNYLMFYFHTHFALYANTCTSAQDACWRKWLFKLCFHRFSSRPLFSV